jgi:hypothetical protein
MAQIREAGALDDGAAVELFGKFLAAAGRGSDVRDTLVTLQWCEYHGTPAAVLIEAAGRGCALVGAAWASMWGAR